MARPRAALAFLALLFLQHASAIATSAEERLSARESRSLRSAAAAGSSWLLSEFIPSVNALLEDASSTSMEELADSKASALSVAISAPPVSALEPSELDDSDLLEYDLEALKKENMHANGGELTEFSITAEQLEAAKAADLHVVKPTADDANGLMQLSQALRRMLSSAPTGSDAEKAVADANALLDTVDGVLKVVAEGRPLPEVPPSTLGPLIMKVADSVLPRSATPLVEAESDIDADDGDGDGDEDDGGVGAKGQASAPMLQSNASPKPVASGGGGQAAPAALLEESVVARAGTRITSTATTTTTVGIPLLPIVVAVGVVAIGSVVLYFWPRTCRAFWMAPRSPPTVNGAGGTLNNIAALAVAPLVNNLGVRTVQAPPNGATSTWGLVHKCVKSGAFLSNGDGYGLAGGHALTAAELRAIRDMANHMLGEYTNAANVPAQVQGDVTNFHNGVMPGAVPGTCVADVTATITTVEGWRAHVAGNPIQINGAAHQYCGPESVWFRPMRILLGVADAAAPRPCLPVAPAAGFAAARAAQYCGGVPAYTGFLRDLNKLRSFITLSHATMAHLAAARAAILRDPTIPIFDLRYDRALGNPRMVAMRLSFNTVDSNGGGIAARARDFASMLLTIARQTPDIGEDMWHSVGLGYWRRTAEGDWTDRPAPGLGTAAAALWPVNKPSRGHLLANQYYTNSVLAMMALAGTANAASQPKYSNARVWTRYEQPLANWAAAAGAEEALVVSGVDGEQQGPFNVPAGGVAVPTTLPQQWFRNGLMGAMRGSTNPGFYWTAIHLVHRPGPPANYNPAADCRTVAFICYNKEDYTAAPGNGAVQVNAARVAQCTYATMAQLAADAGVDPFPGLPAFQQGCAVAAAQAAFGLP